MGARAVKLQNNQINIKISVCVYATLSYIYINIYKLKMDKTFAQVFRSHMAALRD